MRDVTRGTARCTVPTGYAAPSSAAKKARLNGPSKRKAGIAARGNSNNASNPPGRHPLSLLNTHCELTLANSSTHTPQRKYLHSGLRSWAVLLHALRSTLCVVRTTVTRTTVHTKTINGILGKKTEQGHQITTNLEAIGHCEVSIWDLRPKLEFCIYAFQSKCMREQRGISSLNEVRRQALKALQPLRSAPATEVTAKDKAGFKLAPTPTHGCTAQNFATGVQ